MTESHASPCPSCGYCPTCGRKNAAPAYPSWPVWVYPYHWYPYTIGDFPNTTGTTTISWPITTSTTPLFTS